MATVLDQTKRLPLESLHRAFNASYFDEQDGWQLPAVYSTEQAEYSAVRDGSAAGLIDLTWRGRIEVSGTESVAFLNGLITNDAKTLEENRWTTAAFPNAQGRLVAIARVLHVGGAFIIETEAATHDRVLQTLQRYVPAGDFHVRDLSGEIMQFTLQGARAGEILASVAGREASRVDKNRLAQLAWREQRILVFRSSYTAEVGVDMLVPSGGAAGIWEALCSAGAHPVGLRAFEVLRIEAGVPKFGVDVTEANVVLETGLDDAVSFTKGCYIGQEIIARIHWRGHVAKRLAGVRLEDDAGVDVRPGMRLRSADGKEAGRLTSVTRSPTLECTIALAIVKYDYLAAGTELLVDDETVSTRARVAELPFVRSKSELV